MFSRLSILAVLSCFLVAGPVDAQKRGDGGGGTPKAGQQGQQGGGGRTGKRKGGAPKNARVPPELRPKKGDSNRLKREKARKREMLRGNDKDRYAEKTKPQPDQLKTYVAPIVSITPRRIAPGETGELTITLALRENAIMRPGGGLEIKYSRSQGRLRFGEWFVEPPTPATLNTMFRGQLVYDNTAVVRIPVTVNEAAPHRDHGCRFDISSEVTLAATGDIVGPFSMGVNGKVTVGTPVPRPDAGTAPPAVAAFAKAHGGPADLVARPPADGVPTPPRTDDEPVETVLVKPPVREPEPDDGLESEVEPVIPEDEAGGDSSMLLFVGGGVLIGLLGVIVFGRRR